jgi:hypothetical protein
MSVLRSRETSYNAKSKHDSTTIEITHIKLIHPKPKPVNVVWRSVNSHFLRIGFRGTNHSWRFQMKWSPSSILWWVVSSSLVHVARDSWATFPHQHGRKFSRWWRVKNQHNFPKISLLKFCYSIFHGISLSSPTRFCDSPQKNNL